MSLLERRRALMGLNKRLLPLDYQQVKYIESTYGQYIDTGIKGSSKVKLKFDGAFGRTGATFFTGSRTSSAADFFCFFDNPSNLEFKYYKSLYQVPNTSKEKISVEISKDGYYLDDVLQYSLPQTEWSNNYNITIFAVNTAGKFQYGKGHKLYSYKMYEDNILVRDFIPCYRKTDNVVGLYDMKNAKFYEKQGTGNFLIGGEI